MTQTEIEKLRAQLKEAKRELSDLIRNLNESPAIEQEERNNERAEGLRLRVIELERKIGELEKG
jgi:hypothetical protein